METTRDDEDREVYACDDCGQPTSHEVQEFDPSERPLCTDCEEWHREDAEAK